MRFRMMVLGFAICSVLAAGLAFGVTQASAGGPAVTYYACLKSGKLTQVGTSSPTCRSGATSISWNSQGPEGPVGPGSQTYNWNANVPAGSSTTVYTTGNTELSSGSTVAITSALLTGNFSACVHGWSVAFYSSEGSGYPAIWSSGTNVTNLPPTSTSPETLTAQSPMLVVGQYCISSSGSTIPLPAYSFNVTFTVVPSPTPYS